MSRKLFAFLLSELKTVRFVCSRPVCGAVTEVTPSRMESVAQGGVCPVCSHDLIPGSGPGTSPFFKLAVAIQEAQAALAKSGAAQIEFVLPDETV